MASMQRKNANAASARVVLKLGDDISTDAIYPGRYMATVLPTETPRYAFADFAEFSARLQNKEITPGSIVIAGTNFGCGSSREQAASALKGHDIVVIARGFGRIFLQNAVNLGLNIMVCPRLDADEGDELEIAGNQVRNITANKNFDLQPIPAARRAIIDAGGLIPYTRERLLKLQTARSEVR